MEKIQLVEIDLDRCSLEYGVSPCAASISPTEPDKCFNCLASCQDKTHYTKEIVTARYSTVSATIPPHFDAIPNISNVSIRPTELKLGESIGIRASVDVTFIDSRFPDTGPEGDRYLDSRNYDPYKRGSYWGKFRARWPFVQGSDIRLLSGDNNQTIEQMETRHFIVEKTTGPNSAGVFKIQCKDALQLVDGKKAQAPKIGIANTPVALSKTQTTIQLQPANIGSEYPAGSRVQIGGREVATIIARSGDTLTVQRGKHGTSKQTHTANSRVQLCLRYVAKTVTYILNDLLRNYANVPQDFIPLSDWTAEDAAYIGRNYNAIIAEPTDVKTLINELLEQTASSLWWDDINKLLRFRVLRSVDSNAALYSDDIILEGSFSAIDQPSKRVSRVYTYYGQINPLEKLTELKNYAAAQITVNPESENNFNGVSSIKKIYSRWISSAGLDAVERLNNLILSRYATPPRQISLTLQRDSNVISPTLGSGYNISSHTMQDFTGAQNIIPVQTIKVASSPAYFTILAEEVLYSATVAPNDPTVKAVFIQTNEENINLRTIFNSSWSVINPGDTVNITIESSIVIGSSSTALNSVEFGEWPNLITINFINNGIVVGKGGIGGSGGNVPSIFSVNVGGGGGNGGDALNCLMTNNPAINIINNGTIGGGGGGGGGGGAALGPVEKFGSWDNNPYLMGLVSGSGGSGAAYNSNGGGGGVSYDYGYSRSINGSNGAGGSNISSGSGGVSSFLLGPDQTATGGAGGNAGEIGLSGGGGAPGSLSLSVPYNQTSSGGAGGIAGSAINKAGKTVTITNNGTIAGAVNA